MKKWIHKNAFLTKFVANVGFLKLTIHKFQKKIDIKGSWYDTGLVVKVLNKILNQFEALKILLIYLQILNNFIFESIICFLF